MEILATLAAALVVLGAPALATMFWVWSRYPGCDVVESIAAAFGGLGLSCVALWTGVMFFGPSAPVLLLAPILASALLLVGVALSAIRRMRSERRLGGDPLELTGQHDGRVVPDAVVSAGGGGRAERRDESRRGHLVALTSIAAVFVVCVAVAFSTYGLRQPDGIHRMAMTDWYKHLTVTTAVGAADSFPPPNPFVESVDSAPYYYGFHLVAASIGRLAGQEDRAYLPLLLLTLLIAAATPFVAYTVARGVDKRVGIATTGSMAMAGPSRVALFAAIGATLLAGFDLVPLLIESLLNAARSWPLADGFEGLRAIVPSTNLDSWIHHNERQFTAPYVTTIWAPQHMAAALIALLAIHLVLRRDVAPTPATASRQEPMAPWWLPAILIASLPALSAYMAIGLAVGVGGAVVGEALRHKRPLWGTLAWRLWLVPGLAGALLAVPVLAVVGGGAGGGLTIHVSAAGSWINGAVISSLVGERWWAGLLDTAAVYLVEFGIIGTLAVAEIRRQSRKGRLLPTQAHVVALALSIIVFVVFVRPPIDGPNNLYARPLLLVWFLAAPFAAVRFARSIGAIQRVGGSSERAGQEASRRSGGRGQRSGRWVVAGLVICAAANVYAMAGVVLEGGLFWAAPPGVVDASLWSNRNAPSSVAVAIHPDDYHSAFGYWLRRPMALADERHALLFGATAAQFDAVSGELRAAFGASSSQQAATAFDELGVGLILVGSRRPVTWAQAPCFEIAYQNDDWLAVRRAFSTCPAVVR